MERMALSFRMWAPRMFSPRVLPVTVGTSEVEQVLLGQLSLHGRDAACGVQIGHVGGTGRGQMAEIRGLGAESH